MRRRSCCCTAATSPAHSWDLVSLHLSDRYHVFALDQRGHGDSEWTARPGLSIDAKAADALAFVDDQGLESPVIMGHSMGGRVTMHVALARPDLARGLVLVDVGPELSPAGVEVIANFVTNNVEFDDLEVFLDNVVKYDRFRSREHIARTVKYNMLRRADGKYISKVDHRRMPVLVVRPHARRHPHASRRPCSSCAAASPTSWNRKPPSGSPPRCRTASSSPSPTAATTCTRGTRSGSSRRSTRSSPPSPK